MAKTTLNPTADENTTMPAATVPIASKYEEMLSRDLRWAMSEGSLFFEGKGAVQQSLTRIAQRLGDLGIPYAVAGGMALYVHGYRRFTEDVDILVTREGLRRIHEALDGRGYIRPFAKSKNLRDADTKVKIEFLLAGQYPGDGKPKPIAFPDPAVVAQPIDGIQFVTLPTLVNLKLASGISNPARARDLADVGELIRVLGLSPSLAESLDPYVRDRFLELCRQQQAVPKRYVMLLPTKWLATEARSLDEMIETLGEAATTLESMRADGVILDPDCGTDHDYAHLVTTDPAVAKKYGMQDESELFTDDDQPPPATSS